MSADWSARTFGIIKSKFMQNVKILTRINMAACGVSLSRPSMEVFRQCVQSICPMFRVSSLHESQIQALVVLLMEKTYLSTYQQDMANH